MWLRILFRYRKVYITATRGTAKSFTEILALYLRCIMYPQVKLFICAPGKEQASKIAKENIEQIWAFFPLLKEEVAVPTFQKDYTRLVFHNGSILDVVQVEQSARGGRKPYLRPTTSDSSTKNRFNCWKILRAYLTKAKSEMISVNV